jgi:hypothetical protein
MNLSRPPAAGEQGEPRSDDQQQPAPAEPAPAAEPTPAERRSDTYLTGF